MQNTIRYIETELQSVYPKTEISGITRLIIESVTGWDFSQQILHKNNVLENSVTEKVAIIVERLRKHEPIQYILGETEFFDLKLQVNPSVLIPRPETEELVQLILTSDIKKDATILDIGTGSGCIALALKSGLKNARVYGTDISEQALNAAQLNAKINSLEVDFFQADILNWGKNKWQSYDVIVSNPPYVRESEKKQMNYNVLNYEPANALFVSDNDPLIFYRRICEFAQMHLVKNGVLFFEINENLDTEMTELLKSFKFKNIETRTDINGKKRMIYGIK